MGTTKFRALWTCLAAAALALVFAWGLSPGMASTALAKGGLQGATLVAQESQNTASNEKLDYVKVENAVENTRTADSLVWNEEQNAFVYAGYITLLNGRVNVTAKAATPGDKVWLTYRRNQGARIRYIVTELNAETATEYVSGGTRILPQLEEKVVVGPEAPSVGGTSTAQVLEIPEADAVYDLQFQHKPHLTSLSVPTQGVVVTPDPSTVDPTVDAYDILVPATEETIRIVPGTDYASGSAVQWDVDGATANNDIPLTWDDNDRMVVHLTLKDVEGSSADRIITFNLERRDLLFGTQPQSQSVLTQQAQRLTASAKALGTVTYQWYENTTESNEGGTPIEGATESTLVVDAPAEVPERGVRRYFYCVATATDGEGAAVSAASNPAHLGWYISIAPTVTMETVNGGPIPEGGLEYVADGPSDTLVAIPSCPVEEGSYSYYYAPSSGYPGRGVSQEPFEIPTDRDGLFSYRCSVTHSVDNLRVTVYSEDVIFKVVRTQGVVPTFTSQPDGGFAQTGDAMSLSATVSINSFQDTQTEWSWQCSQDRRTWTDLESELVTSTVYSDVVTVAYQAAMPDLAQVYVRARVKQTQTSVTGDVYEMEAYSKEVLWKSLSGWQGSGTEADPYLLQSQEDLQLLQGRVNGQKLSYEGAFFKMMQDLTLPENWTPLGTGDVEAGFTFDGGGHLLTVPEGGLPLIGAPGGCTIKNLDIYGERIAGFGLVQSYAICKDFKDNCVIDNVTIKSGTQTLESGLIGGYASGVDAVKILDCTVEEGVVIGYDKSKSNIGSFAGEFNGTMANCVSHATVYGVDLVGGLVGDKGQAMGDFYVINCEFDGTVEASGSWVGGIAGAGYGGTNFGIESAPMAPGASIRNCLVTGKVSGVDQVGGILGYETSRLSYYNGIGYIENNVFAGEISASGNAVGGIVGQFRGMSIWNRVANNYYLNTCGASRGIGAVLSLNEGAIYAYSGDPMGEDTDELAKPVTASWLAGEEAVTALNAGPHAIGNWTSGAGAPAHVPGPVAYRIEPVEEPVFIDDMDNLRIDELVGHVQVYWSDGSVTTPDDADGWTIERARQLRSGVKDGVHYSELYPQDCYYTHYQAATRDYNDNTYHGITVRARDNGDKPDYPELEGTVYLSVSDDERFAVSDGEQAGVAMASVPVDLAELSAWVASDEYKALGLDKFAHYADADAPYRYDITALHLLAYANKLYSSAGAEGLEITGEAGSCYLRNGFFGHDENLNYFVNGAYPVKGEGSTTGATCDEIVLADGDHVDVGMFSDWDFYQDPAAGFHYFLDEGSAVARGYEAVKGQAMSVRLARSYNQNISATAVEGYQPEAGYELRWGTAADFEAWCAGNNEAGTAVVTGEDGEASVTFPEAGSYVLWAAGGKGTDGYVTVDSVVSAPAHAAVSVITQGAADLAAYEEAAAAAQDAAQVYEDAKAEADSAAAAVGAADTPEAKARAAEAAAEAAAKAAEAAQAYKDAADAAADAAARAAGSAAGVAETAAAASAVESAGAVQGAAADAVSAAALAKEQADATAAAARKAADEAAAQAKAKKKANPMKAKGKTVKAKASKLKKKAQTVKAAKAVAVTGAKGKVTFKLAKVKAKKKLLKQAKKKIKLAANGKLKLKKGLKKGTYKLTVQVAAAGDASYEAATKTVTVKVKVK